MANGRARADTERVTFPYRGLTTHNGEEKYEYLLNGYRRKYDDATKIPNGLKLRVLGYDFSKSRKAAQELAVKAMVLPPGEWPIIGRVGYMHKDPETGEPVAVSFSYIAAISRLYHAVFSLLWVVFAVLLVRCLVKKWMAQRGDGTNGHKGNTPS